MDRYGYMVDINNKLGGQHGLIDNLRFDGWEVCCAEWLPQLNEKTNVAFKASGYLLDCFAMYCFLLHQTVLFAASTSTC